MKNFSDWITLKFVEWQAKEGRRKTIQEFAAYIGISRPLLNMWMNGNKKPGRENIEILAQIFDNEIYDILEIPRPNMYLQRINRVFEFIPPEDQKRLAEEIEAYETQNVSERISKTSKRRNTGKAQ